jgi:hypothetical protein
MSSILQYSQVTSKPTREVAVDEDQARDLVSAVIASGLRLRDLKLTQGQIEDFAAELLPLWKEQPSAAPGPRALGALLPARYVIPDHDLKAVDTCFSVLTAAAGASYFLPQLGGAAKGLAAPLTGIIVAALKLIYNLRLAVRLEPRDYAVVALLSKARADGLSTSALLGALCPFFPDLSELALESSLKAMAACATVSGTKTTLVWKDEAGIWRANGV